MGTRTELIPSLSAEHSPGTNLVWAASSVLAWNALCREAGGDIVLASDDPTLQRLVAHLNGSRDLCESVADAHYLVASGLGTPDPEDLLRQLRAKFGADCPDPQDLPMAPGLWAWAYLFASVPFEPPLYRSARPMAFGRRKVTTFGLWLFEGDEPELEIARVHAPWTEDDENQIVELQGPDPSLRLVVAQISHGATLEETVADVVTRLRDDVDTAELGRLRSGEKLIIPIVDLDLQTQVDALVGERVLTPHGVGPLTHFQVAVRFRLDESGAEVASQTSTGALCLPPRELTFNQPFLVTMIDAESLQPLVAVWVDNDEVLERHPSFDPQNVRIHRWDLPELEAFLDDYTEGLPPQSISLDHYVHVDEAQLQLITRDLSELESLDLSGNPVSPSMVEVLTAHEAPKLRAMKLTRAALTADTLCRLLAWAPPSLEILEVDYNDLGDAGAEQIAAASHLVALRELGVMNLGLTDRGATALAASPHLSNLERLNLNRNPAIGAHGAHTLASSPHLAGLIRLFFHENAPDAEAVAAFDGAPFSVGLER